MSSTPLVDRLASAIEGAPRCAQYGLDPYARCLGLDGGCRACLTMAAAHLVPVIRSIQTEQFLPGRRPLTERQREILTLIEESMTERGIAPSFGEIASRLGMRSLATVHEHLTNLERKGWIRRSYNEARSIELVGAAG